MRCVLLGKVMLSDVEVGVRVAKIAIVELFEDEDMMNFVEKCGCNWGPGKFVDYLIKPKEASSKELQG